MVLVPLFRILPLWSIQMRVLFWIVMPSLSTILRMAKLRRMTLVALTIEMPKLVISAPLPTPMIDWKKVRGNSIGPLYTSYLVATGTKTLRQVEIPLGIDDLWLSTSNGRDKGIDRSNRDSLAILPSATYGWANWVVLSKPSEAVVGFRGGSRCYQRKRKNRDD
jgi:hypothetical protein